MTFQLHASPWGRGPGTRGAGQGAGAAERAQPAQRAVEARRRSVRPVTHIRKHANPHTAGNGPCLCLIRTEPRPGSDSPTSKPHGWADAFRTKRPDQPGRWAAVPLCPLEEASWAPWAPQGAAGGLRCSRGLASHWERLTLPSLSEPRKEPAVTSGDTWAPRGLAGDCRVRHSSVGSRGPDEWEPFGAPPGGSQAARRQQGLPGAPGRREDLGCPTPRPTDR